MQQGRRLAVTFKGAEIQMEITIGVESKTITVDSQLLEPLRWCFFFLVGNPNRESH